MKRILTALALAAMIAVLPANAQQWSSATAGTLISAVGSTTTGTYPGATGIDCGGNTAALVHVVSASTSSATVLIQGSVDGTFWYTLGTVSNPTSAGELWAGPAPKRIRLNLSVHASGTISGFVVFRQMPADPIGEVWKKLDGVAYTFGAVTATSVTDSGLTSGRVPFASTGGLLTDSSALTFSAGTLSATTFAGAFNGGSVTSSTLTSGRLPYVSTSGLIADVANFTYNATTGALTATNGTAPSISTQRFLSTGTAPAVANVGADSCGTTAATIAGKDQAHVITVGATSGTECRVTFNVAFANAPVCTVSGETATDLHLVTTTTTSTITGTLTAGEKLYELCFGY